MAWRQLGCVTWDTYTGYLINWRGRIHGMHYHQRLQYFGVGGIKSLHSILMMEAAFDLIWKNGRISRLAQLNEMKYR